MPPDEALDDAAIMTATKAVRRLVNLSLEEALRGVQYGIELAQKEALDKGDEPRAKRMGERFKATIRVGRKLRK